MQLDCPANVVTDGTTGALLCQDASGASVSWLVSADFDISQVDAETGGAYMAWGFFVVALGWAAGFGIKKAIQFLRSV